MVSPVTSGRKRSDASEGLQSMYSGAPYSPLATPTRSSMRRQGGRGAASTASVRFSGVFAAEAEGEAHTDDIPLRTFREPIGAKKLIYQRYFDPFENLPLNLSPTSPARSIRSRAGSVRTGSVRSSPITPHHQSPDFSLPEAPFTPVSTTHVPSQWATPGRPAWATRRPKRGKGTSPESGTRPPGEDALHAATGPVHGAGCLAARLRALHELLGRAWSRKEVEAAQSWGFFRRLVPLLGVAQLQGPAALLLARCTALLPPAPPPPGPPSPSGCPSPVASPPVPVTADSLLGPVTQDFCAVLPLLLCSPKYETRQAGLLLTGLLWRGCGPLARRHLRAAPRLLDALAARVTTGELVALWALREAAADAASATVLYERGAAGGLGRALRGLVQEAEAEGEAQGGEGEEEAGKGRAKDGQGGGKGRWEDEWPLGSREEREVVAAARTVLVADCITAFSSVHPAAVALAGRHKASERLLRLLLATRVEEDEEEWKGEQGADGDGATQSGSKGDGEAAAAAAAAGNAAPSEVKEATASVAGADGGGEAADEEDEYSLDLEEDEEDEEEKEAAGGDGGGAEGGQDPPAAAGSGGGAVAAVDGVNQAPQHSPERQRSLSARRRRALQVQEALLRALYSLASCGLGRGPQEAVREALRDAGPAATQRLASVMRDPVQLSGCSAAAYLLWLAASGPFSDNPASETNVLRARLAAPAPAPGVNTQQWAPSSSDGHGVVEAVAELLLNRLTGWRDVALGDCVPGAGTKPRVGLAGDGDAQRIGYGGVGGAGEGGAPDSAAGSVSGRPSSGSMAGAVPLFGPEDPQQHGLPGYGGSSAAGSTGAGSRRGPVGAGAGVDGGGLEAGLGGGGGSHGAPGLPRLQLGSGGLLLTPRQSRPMGSTAMASPQRYAHAAGSSDEEEVVEEEEAMQEGGDGGGEEGRRSGGARSSGGRLGPRDGGGGGMGASVTEGTQEPYDDALGDTMDEHGLSDVIDASVELTGKEQVMQAIKAAAASVRATVAREELQRQQAEAEAQAGARAEGEDAAGALGGPTGEGAPGLPGANAAAPISFSGGVPGEGEDLVEVGNLTLPPGQQLLGAAGMGGVGPGMGGGWGPLGMAGGDGAGPAPFSEVQLQHQYLSASLAANASGGLDLGAALSQMQPTHVGHSGQAGSGVAHTPSQWAFTRGAGDGIHSGYTAVGSSNTRLDALRPTALVVAPVYGTAGQQYHLAVQQQQQQLQLQRQRRRSARDEQRLQELNVRLAAVRQIRRRRRACAVPPPEEVQALLCNAVGLLAAVSLSGAGSRAVCEAAGGRLLRHVVALLDVPWVGGGGAVDLGQVPEPAVAAVSGSGLELRLQLLALVGNICLHQDGAQAVAAARACSGTNGGGGGGDGDGAPEVLYRCARLSALLLSSSATSWRAGMQLMEACFTVLANLHRSSASLDIPADPDTNKPRDCYGLAVEAVRMPLPGPMGRSERTRVRAAAARMLDSAISAYEGIGRDVPYEAVSELISLLEDVGGCGARTSSSSSPARSEQGGEGAGPAGPRQEAQVAAACAAAGALWQLMAAGQLHPDGVARRLMEPLVGILRGGKPGLSSSALVDGALGLVSCLARSPLVARRMWASPVVPAVLKAHARARKAGEDSTLERVREVCQQLCRACHHEDRGSVSGTDRRVDKWSMVEKVLTQLKCRLEYDDGEEAIMLVPVEED